MMKALLLKNPISTRQDFAAGGSRIPILTRNPTQSTAGYQNFGLPSGNSTGGSANRTSLGAIRMGDDDGNGPASAIVGAPGEIFFPFRAPDRAYPSVMFENVGNNAHQPDAVQNAAATEVLLRRLGDRQFKATESAPFEDYFAVQKLAKEVDDASRNAGLEDLGHSREIMRSLVAERRKGDEDDFLRRMLDAGMTQQDAQMEIDNVRRANALQEARKVDDRTHQSKLLIQRIAKSRGILSAVNEPLTTTGAIENPQPNEKMADMTGQPENAYGSSPLDRDRVFKTPDFYRKMLRRSALTQEAGDEMSALATATAQAEGDVPTPAMLQGIERQDAIERRRDAVASRLENATTGRKIMGKMPRIIEFFDSVLFTTKRPGTATRFELLQPQDMTSFESILALNQIINQEPGKLDQLKRMLVGTPLKEQGIGELLRQMTVALVGDSGFRVPVLTSSKPFTTKEILRILEMIKAANKDEIGSVKSEVRGYTPFDEAFAGGSADQPLPPPVDTRSAGRVRAETRMEGTRALRELVTGELDAGFRDLAAGLRNAPALLRAQVRAPDVRVVGGGAAAPKKKTLSQMNAGELQEEARRLGLSDAGSKSELAARIRARK